MLIVWLAWLIAICYACLQGYYLYHWLNLPAYTPSTTITPATGVSVVIVVHNESENIQACIKSVLQQKLPHAQFEVIIIDDHSTDDTLTKVKALQSEQVKVFRLEDFPSFIKESAFKKSGVTLGVDQARFQHIVVTDADCVHHPDWLATTIHAFTQNAFAFQTGPVVLSSGELLLEKMQEVEQLTLTLITGAGISSGLHDIASGANMMFTKEAFEKINGYEGNYQFASGDDMFLIEKMRIAFPNQIGFLKSPMAVVYTKAKPTWHSLITQRLRWAGKNKGLKRKSIQCIWMFVGLYHLILLVALGMVISGFWPWSPFLILLVGKWLSDYLVVNASATFFKRTEVVRLFVTLQMLYIWYILRLSLAMVSGKKGDWQRKA